MPIIQEVEVSQDFICPITQAIMLDPVVDSQGRAYERESITRWINQNHTHPTDRTEMKVEDLQKAPALTRQIRRFVEDHPILLENHEVHVPENTGQLMVDAVNANHNGVVSYLIQLSQGNAQRQAWLDGAFAVAANASKLDLMQRLHAAGAALPENTGQLMIDAVKADNNDIIGFYIGALEGHAQRQVWLDQAFNKASTVPLNLELMRSLYEAGATIGHIEYIVKNSISHDKEAVYQFLLNTRQLTQQLLDLSIFEGANCNKCWAIQIAYNEGANVNNTARDNLNTPLGIAFVRGHKAAIKLLIYLGASTHMFSKYGPHGGDCKHIINTYKGDASLKHFTSECANRREQLLSSLPPKVQQLQQEVETLKSTVAQQSAQIAQLLAALQTQQNATNTAQPDSTASSRSRMSSRSRSPAPTEEQKDSTNEGHAGQRSRSPSP